MTEQRLMPVVTAGKYGGYREENKIAHQINSVYLSLVLGIAISLFLICSPALAVFTWDGDQANNSWTTALNWADGVAPAAGPLNTSLVFGAGDTGDRTVTGADGAYIAISGISFAGAAGAYSIAGAGSFSLDAGATITGSGGLTHNLNTIGIVTTGAGVTFAGTDSYTVGGVIADGASAGALTKQDAGTLTLSGTNTYSGGTTLSAGTVVLGNDSALGTGALSVTSSSTIQSNDNSRSLSNAISVASSQTLTVSGTNNMTLGGVISGSGRLMKSGSSTLTLTGTNTYSSNVIIGGTIVLGNNSALGSGVLVVGGNSAIQSNDDSRSLSNNIFLLNGRTLTVSGTNNLTLGGILYNLGKLTKSDSSTLTLTGTNTYLGGTTLNAGTIVLGNNAALGTRTLTLGGAGTLQSNNDARLVSNLIDTSGNALTVSGASNLTLSGAISGTGSLTKSGAGALTLSGTNTYTGTTTISAGTLKVSGGSAIADTGAVSLDNVAGAVFELSNSETIGSLAGGGTTGGNVELNANTLTVGNASSTTYSGAISGTGALTKQGAGTLTLSGNNTYSGGTTVNAGGLTGTTSSLQGNITNNATLTFDQAGSGTYAGIMDGTGTLTKTGTGTITLSGNNTYTGLTTLSAGGLILNGQVGGDFTVAGGTLSGIGTIGGTLNLSGSVCSPGNSIGTMTILGDYVHNTGSTLDVEVEKTASGTLQSDLLDVTGSATLAAGSIISVTDISSGSRLIGTGDTFTIIEADGGVTDNGATITDTSAVLSFTSLISGNNYQLLATRAAFAPNVSGGNRSNVLGAIDSDLGNATGDYITLINAITALDTAQLGNAADKLNPLPHASTTSVALRTTQQMASDLANYLNARRSGVEQLVTNNTQSREHQLLIADASSNPEILGQVIRENERIAKKRQEDGKISGFFRPFGLFYEQDSTSKMTGFSASSSGAQIGIDKRFGPNLIMGIGGGYSHSFINFKEGRGKGDVDSFRIGPYATYFKDDFFLDTSVSLGFHNIENKRNIQFGAINCTAEADYYAYDLSAYIGGGYNFHIDKWTVTPTTSLQYIRYCNMGFKETGAGAAGLDVDASTSESLRSKLGITLSTITELNGTKVVPELFVGWAHEFMDEENIKAKFVDGTAKFITNVDNDSHDSVYFGAGLTVLLKENISAYVRYEGECSSGNNTKALNVGLTLQF